jgi:hypothetical protein
MIELGFIALLAVAALVIAWIGNVLVGMLSGEKPQDTPSLWRDVFLQLFVIKEFGLIGRVLNYLGLTTRVRRIVFFIALLCFLIGLFRS